MSIKDVKINFIAEAAAELFLEKSIGEVTVRDVAAKAGVGEATVYRHFAHKKNLVAHSAVILQSRVYSNYFVLCGSTGYQRLAEFYGGYLKVFDGHAEYYRFISEFDAFMPGQREILGEYSDGLDLFKEEFLGAYKLGVEDGSVKEIEDVETFYYATTHALLGLCKKLAANSDIVRQDETTEKRAEIQRLIDVVLYSVNKL